MPFFQRTGFAPKDPRDRKQSLKKLIETAYGKDQIEIRYVEHFESGGDAVLKSACRMSLEGIVSKQTAAHYASGRTHSCRAGHEVVIGAWNSNGSQFRSLLAGVYRGGHIVYVGNVGTGYGADTVASSEGSRPCLLTLDAF